MFVGKEKNIVLRVKNLHEFFQTNFGKILKNFSQKTSHNFQGQSIYQMTGKLKNYYLKKGDCFYLDNLHLDHIEVFTKNKTFRVVLNIDGTVNVEKTKNVIKQGRTINF